MHSSGFGWRERSENESRKKTTSFSSYLIVPGAGIEPACLAALVFETSASTDSAIRATVCAYSCRAL